jgi:hypothetical protein
MILSVSSDYFLKSANQSIFVMEKCCAFCEVQNEFLYINWARLKMLTKQYLKNLKGLGHLGKSRHRWEDNIKVEV